MVLDKLGSSLRNTFDKITKALLVDEKLINELVKDIQKALLGADVNVKLVFELTNSIKERITKEETPGSLTKKEQLIHVVYEELISFLGKEGHKIELTKTPYTIMLVGLFGNGKTTAAGKMGKYFSKRGHKVALISTDTWRPAAFTQLKTLGDSINVPVFGNPELKDPVEIFNQFKDELSKFDLIIVDTAGRDALSDELIDELNAINTTIKPDERLLVMGADVGQAAQKQAQAFHDTCNVTGVIITKLDGTAKGGGALSACAVADAPVKFIGVGEKIDDLEEFEPKRFVGRLLGMGDMEGLLDKVKDAISEEDAQDLGKKFLKGDFNLIDLYEQMQAMSKMGPLSKVMEMIPGFSSLKMPKEALQVQQDKLKVWRYIMDSCTKDELENPEILASARIERIANGSGTNPKDVRELIKQFKQSKKMMKSMKGPKNMEKMMKNMTKGGMPQMKFK